MRRTGMLVATVACAAVVSGCSATPRACTEIGYVNTLTLEVAGAGAAAVDDLEWCVAGKCTDDALTEARGLGGAQWEVQTFTQTPDELTVVAVDAGGAEIARVDVTVTWTGTDSPNGPGCDNASEAPAVIVPLP
ncbi:hypothetical protein [Microbacterium sp. AG1240]|uniref:hypothetical protein n=1 Tax=Microbacterium sp. AG1240 TaxID=2183992 RepID=UPI0011C48988|nr:hypothetical protein [Microbacterium sp. AG1240]